MASAVERQGRGDREVPPGFEIFAGCHRDGLAGLFCRCGSRILFRLLRSSPLGSLEDYGLRLFLGGLLDLLLDDLLGGFSGQLARAGDGDQADGACSGHPCVSGLQITGHLIGRQRLAGDRHDVGNTDRIIAAAEDLVGLHAGPVRLHAHRDEHFLHLGVQLLAKRHVPRPQLCRRAAGRLALAVRRDGGRVHALIGACARVWGSGRRALGGRLRRHQCAPADIG
jgi:hypothetical protein